jgi:hypothetical protein
MEVANLSASCAVLRRKLGSLDGSSSGEGGGGNGGGGGGGGGGGSEDLERQAQEAVMVVAAESEKKVKCRRVAERRASCHVLALQTALSAHSRSALILALLVLASLILALPILALPILAVLVRVSFQLDRYPLAWHLLPLPMHRQNYQSSIVLRRLHYSWRWSSRAWRG